MDMYDIYDVLLTIYDIYDDPSTRPVFPKSWVSPAQLALSGLEVFTRSGSAIFRPSPHQKPDMEHHGTKNSDMDMISWLYHEHIMIISSYPCLNPCLIGWTPVGHGGRKL